jgi:murein DD-endopeptidase MepM/ murein hydrolase activator NlpD
MYPPVPVRQPIADSRVATSAMKTALMPLVLLILAACGSPNPVGELPPPVQQPETPSWPRSGQNVEDADSVHAPFGPRALPTQYDFHAGVDIPAPRP